MSVRQGATSMQAQSNSHRCKTKKMKKNASDWSEVARLHSAHSKIHIREAKDPPPSKEVASLGSGAAAFESGAARRIGGKPSRQGHSGEVENAGRSQKHQRGAGTRRGR
jgi:hypothetical protein